MKRHNQDTPKRDNPKVSHGKALTSAPRSPYTLDDTNTLDIQMLVGSLKSNDYRFSDENVLAMSSGEIIKFVNATQGPPDGDSKQEAVARFALPNAPHDWLSPGRRFTLFSRDVPMAEGVVEERSMKSQ